MASSFKVLYLQSVREMTKEGFRRFRDRGLDEMFSTAASIIDSGLRTNPREFGDPCFSYPNLQLDIFMRAVTPLVVYCGVHQTQDIVFVNQLIILDGSENGEPT